MTYKEKMEELIKYNERIKNKDENKYKENAIRIIEIMEKIKDREARSKIIKMIKELENNLILDIENVQAYTELEKLIKAVRKKLNISEEEAKNIIENELKRASKIGKDNYNSISINKGVLERSLIIEPIEGFDNNNNFEMYTLHVYSKMKNYSPTEHKIMKINNGEEENCRLKNMQKIIAYSELKNDIKGKECILDCAQKAVGAMENEVIRGALFQNLLETDERFIEYKNIVKEVEREIKERYENISRGKEEKTR